MAMSGVELDQECKKIYDEVQSKKKHRYVTFKIDDGKIRVDKVRFEKKNFCKKIDFISCIFWNLF